MVRHCLPILRCDLRFFCISATMTVHLSSSSSSSGSSSVMRYWGLCQNVSEIENNAIYLAQSVQIFSVPCGNMSRSVWGSITSHNTAVLIDMLPKLGSKRIGLSGLLNFSPVLHIKLTMIACLFVMLSKMPPFYYHQQQSNPNLYSHFQHFRPPDTFCNVLAKFQ